MNSVGTIKSYSIQDSVFYRVWLNSKALKPTLLFWPTPNFNGPTPSTLRTPKFYGPMLLMPPTPKNLLHATHETTLLTTPTLFSRLWISLFLSFIQQNLKSRFVQVSDPACDMSEICDTENLSQWSQLEINLNPFVGQTFRKNNSTLSWIMKNAPLVY